MYFFLWTFMPFLWKGYGGGRHERRSLPLVSYPEWCWYENVMAKVGMSIVHLVQCVSLDRARKPYFLSNRCGAIVSLLPELSGNVSPLWYFYHPIIPECYSHLGGFPVLCQICGWPYSLVLFRNFYFIDSNHLYVFLSTNCSNFKSCSWDYSRLLVNGFWTRTSN